MEQVVSVAQAAGSWLGVPSGMTPWDWINSEFIVAILVLFFGFFFNRKVSRLTEDAEHEADKRRLAVEAERGLEEPEPHGSAPQATARKRSAAPVPGAPEVFEPVPAESTAPSMEDSVAAAPVPSPQPEQPVSANRLQYAASLIINDAKKFVDARLDLQQDERKKRGYDFLGIRDYRLRVIAAQEDGLISDEQAVILRRLFNAWHPYKDGSAIVTQELIDRLGLLMKEVRQAGDEVKHKARTRRRPAA